MVDIFGEIAYTITRTWFCRILSNHVEMCRKKVHDILSNSSFSIDFSKIIVYTKGRERRFSKNRIRKGFINMKKKIFSKAAAVLAVGAIVTGLSGAMAVPASAIDISTLPGSKFQYTLTTEKIGTNKMRLTFRVLNNPGIQDFELKIKTDQYVQYRKGSYELKCKDGAFQNAAYATPDGTSVTYSYIAPATFKNGVVVENATYDKLTVSFDYDITGNYSSDHTIKAGISAYKSYNEPNAVFPPNSDDSPTDASVVISPSKNVRLGDIDNNGKIDTTDLYYVMEMVERTPSKKLSTTYLDQQLKITTSEWYKNYPFLKCAAVADIDHDTVIQKADSDALMQYIAEAGAKVEITNKEINTLFPVTVVYDN